MKDDYCPIHGKKIKVERSGSKFSGGCERCELEAKKSERRAEDSDLAGMTLVIPNVTPSIDGKDRVREGGA